MKLETIPYKIANWAEPDSSPTSNLVEDVLADSGNWCMNTVNELPIFLQKKVRADLAWQEKKHGVFRVDVAFHARSTQMTVQIQGRAQRAMAAIRLVAIRRKIGERFVARAITTSVEDDTVSDQFVPSDNLALYVAGAIAKMKSEYETEKDRLFSGSDNWIAASLARQRVVALHSTYLHGELDEARDNIARNVKLVLSAIGVRIRREISMELVVPISIEHRFSDEVSAAFLASIPMNAYDIKAFLDQLFEELVPAARSGNYGGDWGKLALVSGELALRVNPRADRQNAKWKRANVVRQKMVAVRT